MIPTKPILSLAGYFLTLLLFSGGVFLGHIDRHRAFVDRHIVNVLDDPIFTTKEWNANRLSSAVVAKVDLDLEKSQKIALNSFRQTIPKSMYLSSDRPPERYVNWSPDFEIFLANFSTEGDEFQIRKRLEEQLNSSDLSQTGIGYLFNPFDKNDLGAIQYIYGSSSVARDDTVAVAMERLKFFWDKVLIFHISGTISEIPEFEVEEDREYVVSIAGQLGAFDAVLIVVGGESTQQIELPQLWEAKPAKEIAYEYLEQSRDKEFAQLALNLSMPGRLNDRIRYYYGDLSIDEVKRILSRSIAEKFSSTKVFGLEMSAYWLPISLSLMVIIGQILTLFHCRANLPAIHENDLSILGLLVRGRFGAIFLVFVPVLSIFLTSPIGVLYVQNENVTIWILVVSAMLSGTLWMRLRKTNHG